MTKLAIVFLLITETVGLAQKGKQLTEVYHNDTLQLTGITISNSGRLFVNFPRWSDYYVNAVIEILPNGSTKPFPDESWNRWDGKQNAAGKAFVCVQSVVVDDTDTFWVLDPAAPLFGPVVTGGAKLVQIDLKSNSVTRVIAFGPEVAKSDSYLNDVRFDTQRKIAYITDSGSPGIVVVDLASGKARRTLDGHPSTKLQPGVDIKINGKSVRDASGKPPSFNSDGIALSADREYLYYQALTGATLYRIKTSVLRDANANPDAVGAAVETVAQTFPVDGMWMDKKGRLYLSGLNQGAILRRSPDGRIETVAADPRIQWPDTFSEGSDGTIYFTTSHIQEMPRYNQGKRMLSSPFGVFKFTP
ncbi:MAG: SMP-30/gluconolactonase/LRE family protein [Bryobacteraceae bacterium]